MKETKKKQMLAKIERLSDVVHKQWVRTEKTLNELIAIIEAIKSDDDIRAEITGRSTRSSSGSHGNTGYSGGCTPAAA